MKFLSKKIIIVILTSLLFSFIPRTVYAGETTSIVMTYKGTTYSKVLYDVEIEMIKSGTTTSGLINIGEMCDNVSVLTGGTVTIDKALVINTIKSSIASGKTGININLEQYIKGIPAEAISQTVIPSASDSINPSANTDVLSPVSDAVSQQPSGPAVAPPAKPAAYSPAMKKYFTRSVFVGDSIMVGLRNYSMKDKNSCLNNSNFLAAVSYSLRNGLREVSNYHPSYKGAKRPVWESIEMMDVDRVFIMFGMNDLPVGIDKTCENYVEFINKIKKAKPNIEINIISMTNVLAGHEKAGLNNANIRAFNTELEALCNANGWGFCNLAPYLVDANGALASPYCSDQYVHQTHKAYSEVWEPVLYNFAVSKGVK